MNQNKGSAMYEWILYEKSPDQYATITLNRPEKLNAISIPMMREIVEALHDADQDDAVKVVVLKGAGGSFSSGHDLSNWGEQYGMKPGVRPPQRPRAMADRDFFWDLYPRIFYTLKPKIAQVHGYCLEGGIQFTLLCDITVAAEDAIIGFPGQRAGDAGLSLLPMLFNLIGYKRTRELLLTGATMSGRKAEEIGLVNRSVKPQDLDEVVIGMAKAIALMPIDGIVMGQAYSHVAFDRAGFSSGLLHMAYGHAWWTNIKYEPGDWNLLKRRAEIGLRDALHERDARYDGLLAPDLGGLLAERDALAHEAEPHSGGG